MKQVKTVWAYTQEEDGVETVVATGHKGWMMPLVATSKKAAMGLYRELAQKLATSSGKSLKLVKFTAREEVDSVSPAEKGVISDKAN